MKAASRPNWSESAAAEAVTAMVAVEAEASETAADAATVEDAVTVVAETVSLVPRAAVLKDAAVTTVAVVVTETRAQLARSQSACELAASTAMPPSKNFPRCNVRSPSW